MIFLFFIKIRFVLFLITISLFFFGAQINKKKYCCEMIMMIAYLQSKEVTILSVELKYFLISLQFTSSMHCWSEWERDRLINLIYFNCFCFPEYFVGVDNLKNILIYEKKLKSHTHLKIIIIIIIELETYYQ